MPFDLIISETSESALAQRLAEQGVIQAGEGGFSAKEGFVVSFIGDHAGKKACLVGVDENKLPAAEVRRIETALRPLEVKTPSPLRVWAGPKGAKKPYWEMNEEEKAALFPNLSPEEKA